MHIDDDYLDCELGKLSINDDDEIPKFILDDLQYLANCYVNNITQFDFSSNIDAMNDMNEICELSYFPSYNTIYKLLKQYVINLNKKNVFINQSLLQTYIDYYIEQITK